MHIAADRMKSVLRWCEYGYVVAVISSLTYGPIYSIWNSARISIPLQPIEPALLATYVGIQIPAVFILGRRWCWNDVTKPTVYWLTALVVFLMLTTVWTDMGRNAAGDSLKMALSTMTGLYIVKSFGRREQIWLIWAAMQCCVVASRFAIWHNWADARAADGDWQGIFTNPNFLGPVASIGLALSVLILIDLLISHKSGWRIPFLILVGDVVLFDAILLYQTRSWTSIGSTVAFLLICAIRPTLALIGQIMKIESKRLLQVSILAIAGAFFSSMVILYRFFWLLPTNMKNFLYERHLAWAHSLRGVQAHPFSGWGFNVAWNNLKFRKLDYWWTVEHLGHSHSAYLEVLLSGGIIAGVLLLIFLFRALWHLSIEWPEGVIESFGVALAFYCLIASLFEPFIVTGYFLWPLLIIGLLPGKQPVTLTNFDHEGFGVQRQA